MVNFILDESGWRNIGMNIYIHTQNDGHKIPTVFMELMFCDNPSDSNISINRIYVDFNFQKSLL